MAMSTYESEVLQWRSDRAAALKADGGWLSLAGLFWLHEGSNPFGKDPSNEIALPDGPAHAGDFQFHNGKVSSPARISNPTLRTRASRWDASTYT